jgi:hypothetical protein
MVEGICISIPSIVKASTINGDRIIEVQASSEDRDQEGDVILQKALLDSAPYFIATGHIDIDHISELGHRYGIKNPNSYIVGTPLEVLDKGSGHTYVKSKLYKNSDGDFNPKLYTYDMVWASLHTDPPAKWSASIFGYPKSDAFIDCSEDFCENTNATRYLVKGLEWHSLALTKSPVNSSLKGFAKIVKANTFMKSRFPSLQEEETMETSCCCSKVRDLAKAYAASYVLKALVEALNKSKNS